MMFALTRSNLFRQLPDLNEFIRRLADILFCLRSARVSNLQDIGAFTPLSAKISLYSDSHNNVPLER